MEEIFWELKRDDGDDDDAYEDYEYVDLNDNEDD